ncbi:MAG: hypothetical protein ABII90_14740 [Bacteroidota bacterium]
MGLSSDLGAGGIVHYTQKTYGQPHPSGIAEGTTHFYENVLVHNDGGLRRFGVNILFPKRSADILDDTAPQLRLTHTDDARYHQLLAFW